MESIDGIVFDGLRSCSSHLSPSPRRIIGFTETKNDLQFRAQQYGNVLNEMDPRNDNEATILSLLIQASTAVVAALNGAPLHSCGFCCF
jgi:hypothetical protein